MTVASRFAASFVQKRSGLRHLVRSYAVMVRFEATNLRVFLAITLVIQTLMGAGMAVMYGFYFGDMSETAKTFLVSGIPALALFPVGFVLVPASIADYRFEETYDFIWSLPVPRLASAAATFTVFTALAIPGSVVALGVASLVHGVSLTVSAQIVPAVLLSGALATSVGYAMGHGIERPEIVNLVTNLLVFVVLLFSPIVVPIEAFPEWLQTIHRGLPFWHMANLVRAGLSNGLVTDLGFSYVVAGMWTAGAAAFAGRLITRRR
jgi:ABC-2 type transport system permease protein